MKFTGKNKNEVLDQLEYSDCNIKNKPVYALSENAKRM